MPRLRRSRPTALVGAVMAALLLLTGGVPVQADEVDDKRALDQQIEEAHDHLDDVSQSLVAALRRFEGLNARLPAARARVAEARGAQAAARAREAALADQLVVAEQQVLKAQEELAQVKAEISAAEQQLGLLASTTYQQGSTGGLAVYLDARSVEDMLDRLAYTQSAAQSETALLRRLADDRADVAAKGATLEAKRVRVAQLRAEAADLVRERDLLAAEALEAARQATALVNEAAAAADVLAKERAAELKRMEEMQAESRRLSQVLAQRATTARARAAAAARTQAERQSRRYVPPPRSAPPPAGSQLLSYPVDGRISSPFGMRVHPITGVYKLHDGTDFASPCGTPIYAAAAGEVVEAGYSGAWGNRVVIDNGLVNGSGLATGYNHLTSFAVGGGDRVARGEVVGYVGSTGYSTGCHLHFNVYIDGNPVNPMNYL